jgi:PAS domain S-box-containing protein
MGRYLSFGERLRARPLRWAHVAIGACLVVAIAAGLVWLNEVSERRTALNEQAARLSAQVDARARKIDGDIQRLRSDALFLAGTPPARGLAEGGAAHGGEAWAFSWSRQLETIFLRYAKENPKLDKLRLIGVADNGMELVAVERRGGVMKVIDHDQLRAKSGRYYFVSGLNLNSSESDVSDFTLERYNNKVVTPNIPMLRTVAPVFAADGKLFGMVVLNVDARPMFDEVAANMPANTQFYLTTGNGDYLLRPDGRFAFGFDLGRRYLWQDDFKPLARETGLPKSLTAYRTATGRVYTVSRGVRLGKGGPDRILTISMTVPGSYIDGRVGAVGAKALISVLVGALVSALLFYLYWNQNQRVRVQQRRLAALVEGANDAIIGQRLDGVITDWNRAAERMFGHAAGEAVGRTALELIVPETHQGEEPELLARIARGEAAPHFNTCLRRGDGGLIDVSMSVSPLFAADGRVVGVSKTVTDISEQVATEAALTEARARLVVTTQASGVGIWEWDVASESLRWDDTMLALYGVSREDFDGSYGAWRALLHPDDVEAIEAAMTEAMAARVPFDIAFRIRTPAGQVRHMRIKGAVSYGPTRRPLRLLGTNIDISADKEREAEIEALNANLEGQVAARTAQIHALSTFQRAILANAAHAIIATDVKGVVTVFNPAAERLFDRGADEMIGKRWSVIRFDKDQMATRAAELTAELGKPIKPGFETIIAKALDEVVEAHEWTCILKDGTRRPVLLSTTALRGEDEKPFGYLNMLVDRSAHTEHRRAMQENDRVLRAVIENIPSIVAYWDRNLRFKFGNNLSLSWFGKSDQELSGATLPDVMGKNLYYMSNEHISAALGGVKQSFERVITGNDGAPFYAWIHYVPVFADGEVDGICVVVSDITEMKTIQIELKTANEALELRTVEAESATVAKSMFLANMSHEIRSPLNIIIGMLQLLLRTELSVRQDDYVTKAYSSTNALLYLLGDMLDFSRIEAGKISLEVIPFGVEPLVRDISAGLAESLGAKSLDLRYRIDASLPPVLRGDVFRIRQVLINLIGNAIKFTQKGEVMIEVCLKSEHGGRHDVEFSVRDTGIGIAPEQLSSIFEGFTQAEASITRRYGGAGLGLAISKSLVALMGGDLRVVSELGVGSRFYFTLSLEAADMERLDGSDPGEPAEERLARTQSRRLAGLHLLVVDDNELNLQVARELLSIEGAVVELADGGLRGIDMALAASPSFDAVMLDVQMPGMDGFEAARRIRENPSMSAVPIIAMTAHAMESDMRACLAAGMNDHIAKPIDLDVMVETILAHCRPPPPDQAKPAARGSGDHAAGRRVADQSTDLDLALRRLGGNTALFKTITQSFIRDSGAMVENLQSLLRAGSNREACRLLHTLKGLAGTLGLTMLAADASDLEREVEAARQISDADGRIARLRIVLARGVATLQTRLDGLEDVDAAQPYWPEGDTMVIRSTIDRLDSLLEGANLRALEVHDELRGLCGAKFADDLAPLSGAMDRFDFKKARQELALLRSLWP